MSNSPTSKKPAGGRGAIKGSINAFARQQIPLKLLDSFWHANKVFGFDCPGCAFPDKPGGPLIDSCEQGQKAIAWEMTRKNIGADFFNYKTPQQLRALSEFELESHGRLTTPILFDASEGRYRAITWNQAFDVIERELKVLPPEQVAFYASGRSSNEAAFLWQLSARAYGCANLPDSSNFCHEPSGYALKQSIGSGKGTCSLDDFEHAELIIVMGQNPASNHPRMMAALYEARMRGAVVLAFNPLRERGFSNFSDPKNIGELISGQGKAVANQIYQVQIGGDLAALKGVMKALLEMDRAAGKTLLDHDFIKTHTEGFEALHADLDQCPWAELIKESGLGEDQMREVAEYYARSKASIVSWCMGITHHQSAIATIQNITNLLLLKGNIGRRGAGAIPMRGHSNVQGDRTMGATSSVPASWLDNMSQCFPGLQPTRAAGLDAAGVISGLFKKDIKAVLSLGGNFGVAAPDAPRVLEQLSQCQLTVHIATKLNRTHCYPGRIGLILPTLGRTDIDAGGCGRTQLTSTEDSMSNVRVSQGLQAPISEQQLSEPMIVAQIGARIAQHPRAVNWHELASDYERIRDVIEFCQRGVTEGFEQFNQRLNQRGRISLPNPAARREWKTATGKAQFMVHATVVDSPLRRARQQRGSSVLALMTVRSHDQFNTTVYSNDDRYRGVFGNRRVIFMHAQDLQDRGLCAGDRVDIESISEDGVQRQLQGFTAIAYDVPRSCAAAYFPEATALVSSASFSAHTQTPLYKEVPVMVRPASSAAG